MLNLRCRFENLCNILRRKRRFPPSARSLRNVDAYHCQVAACRQYGSIDANIMLMYVRVCVHMRMHALAHQRCVLHNV